MAPWYGVGQDTAEESSNAHVLPTTPTPTPTPTPEPAPAAGESAMQADCPERPLFPIRNRTQSNKIAKKKYTDTLIKQYYRRYEMDWLKLREWLVDKFPDVEFRERYDSTKDNFVFYIPRDLTEEDLEELKKLRNDWRE